MVKFFPGIKKLTYFIVAIITLASCSSAQKRDNANKGYSESDKIASRLKYLENSFSGQILVARNDSIIFERNYGWANREENIKTSSHSLYDICSITKQFTAVAILQLVDKGKLKLKDSLGMFFPHIDSIKSTITIHQLLTHTSGLPEYSGKDADKIMQKDLIHWLDTTALDNMPGKVFSYSNPGYSILALLIERISGQSYEQFLKENIFDPCRMNQTGYRLFNYNPENLTIGYLKDTVYGNPIEMYKWNSEGPYWNLRGNGGLLSNAIDLYRFNSHLLSGKLLSENSLKLMLDKQTPTNLKNRYYGYGVWMSEDKYGHWHNHTGGNGIYYSDLLWYDDRATTIVILTNNFKPKLLRHMYDNLLDVVFSESEN